jgi:hypothetical protein
MKSLSGEDQSLAYGGMTYAEVEARSEQSLHELLSAAIDVVGSDMSIEDIAWLHFHPKATHSQAPTPSGSCRCESEHLGKLLMSFSEFLSPVIISSLPFQ